METTAEESLRGSPRITGLEARFLNTSIPKPSFTFAFVLLQKFSMFSLSALLEPLRIANYCSGRNLYGWRFLSADGKDVPASTGVMVPTNPVSMDDSAWDAIIICGGWNAERYDCAELFSWLQHMGRSGIILGAIETGSYILASAGLLQGYAATIHWHCHNAFKERYPLIDLKDALYVIDRKRMTCAGGTAGLDMISCSVHRFAKLICHKKKCNPGSSHPHLLPCKGL